MEAVPPALEKDGTKKIKITGLNLNGCLLKSRLSTKIRRRSSSQGFDWKSYTFKIEDIPLPDVSIEVKNGGVLKLYSPKQWLQQKVRLQLKAGQFSSSNTRHLLHTLTALVDTGWKDKDKNREVEVTLLT